MNTIILNFCNYAKKQTTQFVLVNLFVSMIGFVRSFVFMRWLGLEELGLISLAQTVMQFISLFQFGLINGGYRLFSLNKLDDQKNVNNVLFTFFAIIFVFFLTGWCIIVGTGNRLLMDNDLLLVSILSGILMLINNWLNNTLIGKQKLSEINIINLISCFVSLAAICTIPLLGFWGAVLSITLQPLCFVILTIKRNNDLRPTKFLFDIKYIRYILNFGFIPFLSGMFTLLNLQIERWSIASILGNEALGRFYLVFLYNSLFLLIPNSIQNIFFPRAVLSYDKGDYHIFKRIVKQYLSVTLLYDTLIVLMTVLFFNIVVGMVFPVHKDNTMFVFLVLPGLMAVSFEGITSLVLNSTVRLKPIFVGSLLGLAVNFIMILILMIFHSMTLTYMAILKSVTLMVPFLVSACYSITKWNDIKNQCLVRNKHK